MTVRDVTAALTHRDCTVHACAKEADGPDGLCEEHRQEPRPGPQPQGVWCPACEELVLPIHGRCGWCDREIAEDDDPIELSKREEPIVAQCKIDGCFRPALDARGRYAGLCAPHKQEKRQEASAAAPPPVAPDHAHANRNGEAPPGSLAQLASRVDTARLELDNALEEHKAAIKALRAAVEVA